MILVKDKKIVGQTVPLDNMRYEGCKIERCEIVFNGAKCELVDTDFNDTVRLRTDNPVVARAWQIQGLFLPQPPKLLEYNPGQVLNS